MLLCYRGTVQNAEKEYVLARHTTDTRDPPGHRVEAAQVLLAPPQWPLRVRRAPHRPWGGGQTDSLGLAPLLASQGCQDNIFATVKTLVKIKRRDETGL